MAGSDVPRLPSSTWRWPACARWKIAAGCCVRQNNGYTLDVDPYGRVVARLPVDVRASLEAPYAYRSDLTLYTQWGDWLPWLAVFASLGFLALGQFGGANAKRR